MVCDGDAAVNHQRRIVRTLLDFSIFPHTNLADNAVGDNKEGRSMVGRDRLAAYLNRHRIPFAIQEHAPTFTTLEVAERAGVSGRMLAKVVLVVPAEERLVMVVLSADRRVDLAKVSSAIGAEQVRLATEQEFLAAFPNCELGAMSPFGNLYGVPVYVDQALAHNQVIFFRAGSHTEIMSVWYADFEALVRPAIVDLSLTSGAEPAERRRLVSLEVNV
jgi:Ala-tRNA(Pro) deacylase